MADMDKSKSLQQYKSKTLTSIAYKGNIKYCTTFIDCAMACDSLLTTANKSVDELVVGFDMEWPFSFTVGSGKTAVIQISPSLEDCLILHVAGMKSLPKTLTEFLQHPKVRLTGVCVPNDIRKLGRDFKGLDVQAMLGKCVETGALARGVLPVKLDSYSMSTLVEHCFRQTINKNKKVRQSKWDKVPLTKDQILYAATDAYVSLKLYHYLKELKINNDNSDILGKTST